MSTFAVRRKGAASAELRAGCFSVGCQNGATAKPLVGLFVSDARAQVPQIFRRALAATAYFLVTSFPDRCKGVAIAEFGAGLVSMRCLNGETPNSPVGSFLSDARVQLPPISGEHLWWSGEALGRSCEKCAGRKFWCAIRDLRPRT